jgi:hypothetical protein
MSLDQGGVDPALAQAENVVAARAAINLCSASQYCPVPTKGCPTPPGDGYILGPKGVVENHCLSPGCHSPVAGKALSGGVLPLTSPSGGVPAAIKQLVSEATVATESATGPDPLQARRSPKDVFGQNMPVIDAHNPGNSYLVYKIILGLAPRCGHLDEESANPALGSQSCLPQSGQLTADQFLCKDIQCMPDAGAARPQVDGGPPGQAGQPAPPIVPGWVPDSRWMAPAAGEYDRLRSRIRGDGMPPPTKSPDPTPYQNARAISAWIATGASDACP